MKNITVTPGSTRRAIPVGDGVAEWKNDFKKYVNQLKFKDIKQVSRKPASKFDSVYRFYPDFPTDAKLLSIVKKHAYSKLSNSPKVPKGPGNPTGRFNHRYLVFGIDPPEPYDNVKFVIPKPPPRPIRKTPIKKKSTPHKKKTFTFF